MLFLLLLGERLNPNNMLLWIVGTGGSTSVNGVYLSPRKHVNGVLDRAHGVANSAASAVSLDNFGEGVVSIELDSLIS
jgi:hypothetical protein